MILAKNPCGVCDLGQGSETMGGDHRRLSSLLQSVKGFDQPPLRSGVKAEYRFVQKENIRVHCEHGTDGDLPLFASA